MQAFDLDAARRAAEAGTLEAWVHEYLCGPGRNLAFSRGLHLQPRRWHGPVEAPLASLRRSCGPEPEMPFREPADLWEGAVDHLVKLAAPIEAFPPLLVRYEQGQLVISDGNHRHAAFTRLGLESCWIILWYPSVAEFEHHRMRGFGVHAAWQALPLAKRGE
jgi:hypothetical protein